MKINSLSKKLFFSYLLKALFIGVLFVVAANYNVKANNMRIFTNMLTTDGKIISSDIAELFNGGKYKEIDDYVKRNVKGTSIRITVINASGNVIADSLKNPKDMENHLNREEVSSAFNGKDSVSVRRSVTLNEDLLYVAMPLYNKNNEVAVLRMSMPLKNISVFSYEFISRNYLMLVIIIAFSLIVSFFLSRTVGKNTMKLKNAFEELSKGNFNIRSDIKSGDELEELSNTFNIMSEQMYETFKQTDNARDELDKIISSVSDAIMVIDGAGKIILANKSFLEQFWQAAFKDVYYWQLFDGKIFDSHIKNYERPSTFLFDRKNKYYSCTIARIKSESGFVIVFHDITDMKNIESFKKDLVGNVSHELKTPLASIKLYLELSEEENNIETLKRHLAVISKNTQRLSDIVNDLMTLSATENKRALTLEKFRLKDLFAQMQVLFQEKAAAKNIKLSFECAQNVTLTADKFRLSQVLSNVIDNALRYTEKGSVSVWASLENNIAVFKIKDTGIGMAKEHLDKIFERFYVIDKSRSRKTGGTGLGLSIVKHIVDLHGGVVKVESSLNEGTVFTIQIPQLPSK
ncbi:ATP-binding protein [Endomicrobium proavitum]|uniref:histidine kinase n=1 Tax=Endomicrobium proavitum TaxID=1408281 RepID=A0A0G3WKI7_9BACT|nr:ATP-binding protein [Endomicrobium proavitum]AKL98420.1 putative phosphate regulon sensor protein [Endomicrobium proavitum]